MTYEYACEVCGHQWEAEQSIKDPPLKKCVSCGKAKAKRLVSGGTGFLLKGGGWYADGYGSKAAASSPSSGETPASKASATDTTGGGESGTTGEGKAKKEAKASSPAESPAKPDAAPKPAPTPTSPNAKAS
jgi:putative FmdB family regulatory protein